MFSLSLFVLLVSVFSFIEASGIYHEKSRIRFHSQRNAEYFGYSVSLSASGLLIGAPKGKNKVHDSKITGTVYSCRLHDLSLSNVTCDPLQIEDSGRNYLTTKDLLVNDAWFGASIAAVPGGKVLVCGPRWMTPYRDRHLLANGACYVQNNKKINALYPLREPSRLAFIADGFRREYGEYGVHLNFYAYGQAGMSVKMTGNNSVIIGAPGLLQWTGGIIDYKFNSDPNSIAFSKQLTANPYYTKDLGPDDYLGYSVESGVFEINGSTLYVAAAPRSRSGYGQILIFEPVRRELESLKVKAKLKGPQLGSYFGASMSCVDINGDGRDDLLVGAPNYIMKNMELPYDQGAVFIYFTKSTATGFDLELTGYVTGSEKSGARFGSSIADLGDIDSDSYRDVAIGAPWENNGLGAVYIYRGSKKGIENKYSQRIVNDDARSFGMSISKGIDVDWNNCNDFAIGAFGSNTAYLYRCIPSIEAHVSIQVPDAMNLEQNATNFTAIFCVQAPERKLWPSKVLELKGVIQVDSDKGRAEISGDNEYGIKISPGSKSCDEQIIKVKPTADLSNPITIQFRIEAVKPSLLDKKSFDMNAVRLSDVSTLHTSFQIQLTRDCGDDLICRPWLELNLEPFNSPYIPGSADKLGVQVSVLNKDEPSYGAKVSLALPSLPVRVPSSCTLEDFNMTCNVPSPLSRKQSVVWEIELENPYREIEDKVLTVLAELDDSFYETDKKDKVKDLNLLISPRANFSASGKAVPNTTVTISREKFNNLETISITHYFEVTNFGPSDWSSLATRLKLSEMVSLGSPVKDCKDTNSTEIECNWSLNAKHTLPVILSLKFPLENYGQLLEKSTTLNITSELCLIKEKINVTITTTLVLAPAPPIWPPIVGAIAGILLLAAIVYGLYKLGFFSRQQHEHLKKLQEESEQEQVASSSSDLPSEDLRDESTLELLQEDSD